jgi:hypothetical protein
MLFGDFSADCCFECEFDLQHLYDFVSVIVSLLYI